MQLTRVDLDSDVFRNHDFINWLSINKENLSVDLSVIVYLETLFWYLTKSLSIDDFELDLEEIQAGITPFDSSLAQDAAERAIKSILPFKHHARDFIIGSSSIQREAILLTYNIVHFLWMPKGTVTTPEKFIENYKKR